MRAAIGRLGVFAPLAEQEATMKAKWGQGDWHVDVLTLRPGTTGAELDAAIEPTVERA